MTVGVPRETRAARPRGALAAATLVLAALVFAFAAHPYTRLPFAGEHGLYSHGAQQLAAGGVPYRDFCGHDGIGIYLLHFAAHEAFGYTMSALRLFDLAWMLAAFALLYAVCRRGFGPLAAAFAVLFAVITYFSLGYRPTAQRDGFALLPLLLALRLQFEVGRSRGRDHALHLGIGLAMAGVFWLKPPLAALGVVFALAPLFAERGRTADALLRAWPGLAGGFLLGVGAGVAYLARHGALLDAHECLIVYNLEYAGQRYALLDQLRYLARTSAATPVGFAGLVGLAMGAVRPGLRLPAALTLSVAALVLLQGKLIDYHRVPLQLLLCAWCGYLVARLLPGATAAGGLRVQARRLAVALLVVAALADFARGDTARAYLELWSAPSEAHARREESEIARFLARRTEPGESVLIWGVAGAGNPLREPAPVAVAIRGDLSLLSKRAGERPHAPLEAGVHRRATLPAAGLRGGGRRRRLSGHREPRFGAIVSRVRRAEALRGCFLPSIG
ncbi:MAG: hypothetical protein JSU66_05410 [Deltaproteobacteria bacterium]|nr:MAG: hypothetical protein JSU66_05410 [Deltaproteobacteria bacterium]